MPEAPAALTMEGYTALQAALEPAIRGFVRRLLGANGDDLAVDDLVQETFIALYRKLTARDAPIPPEAARPYAYGIARNLAYAELRRIERYGLALAADHDQAAEDGFAYGAGYAVAVDPAAMPEETAYWMLLNADVQAAIDRLPEAQRQVLILFCEEGLSYHEIAVIMGVNVGTVKSRLHYAKRALRGLLSAATLHAIDQELSD
ncbi:MAG: RNA polymerase sigma factor [bacterium]|nr:RNA polymerase sigma factor [bacterium]